MCVDLFQIYVWKIKSSWGNLFCTWHLNIWWRLRPQSFYLKTINLMKVVLIPMLKDSFLDFVFFCNLDEIWPLYIDFKINTTQLSLLLLHKTESLTLSLIFVEWTQYEESFQFMSLLMTSSFHYNKSILCKFCFFCIAEVFMCILTD